MHSSRCKSLCELTDSKDLALFEDNGMRQVGLDQNLRFFLSIKKRGQYFGQRRVQITTTMANGF